MAWGEKLGGVHVMDEYMWTRGVAEGDEIIVISGSRYSSGRDGASIKSVAKVTDTRITVDGKQYNKADGRERGGYGRIQQATPEALEKVKTANRRANLEHTLHDRLFKLDKGSMGYSGRYPTLSNDQIERMLAILAEPPKCEVCTGKPGWGGPLIDCSECGAMGVHKGG